MHYQLSKGQTINDTYEVIALIGEGGSGIVYMALQIDMQRTVALKILKVSGMDSDDWLPRFQREGRILASLNHPNIIVCYAAGQWNARIPFLVFEHLQGKSLRDLIREKDSLDLPLALEITIQVCGALAHAHSLNIVHRDLKPENIMLVAGKSSEQVVKVLDFGLAAMLDTEDKLTKSGILIGSASYMSPEQCQGKRADQRSDIYSTGCMLYECIAGIPPHQGDTAIELIYKHTNEQPRRIGELRKNIPESLNRILLKAMAKDSDDRYESAAEMRSDLFKLKESIEHETEFDSSQITLAPALSQAARQPKPKKLNRASLILGLTVVSVLAALLFILSDTVAASILVWSGNLAPQQNRVNFLENAGDQLCQYKRVRAGYIVYAQALKYAAQTPVRLRLFSKMSVSELASGSNTEAAHSAEAYFALLAASNCTTPEIESLKRVVSVLEQVPLTWNDDMYRGILRCLQWGVGADVDYQISYNTCLTVMIADSPRSLSDNSIKMHTRKTAGSELLTASKTLVVSLKFLRGGFGAGTTSSGIGDAQFVMIDQIY